MLRVCEVGHFRASKWAVLRYRNQLHTLDEIEKVKGIAKLTIHDERPDKH
jgi:hypothetical protein